MADSATPSRAARISPASTPSADLNDGSPIALTPRSKIKAMLAALDDDSDTEAPLKSRDHTKPTSTSSAQQTTNNGNGKIHAVVAKAGGHDSADHASDESEEEVVRPRGRLAARLREAKRSSESDGEKSDGLSAAYNRVRRQLMSNKKRAKEVEPANEADVPAASSPPTVSPAEGEALTQELPEVPIKHMQISSVSGAEGRSQYGGLASTVSGPSEEPIENGTGDSDSDDLPEATHTNARFLALVERKRKERLEREAAAQKEKEEKAARLNALSVSYTQSGSDSEPIDNEDEEEVDRRLTQQARPTRKASKKALQEMSRETQRMHRNMQLAHEARTKKKIRKDSLFARFNYRPSGSGVPQRTVAPETVQEGDDMPPTSASASDDEAGEDTPPTSPATYEDAQHIKDPLENSTKISDRQTTEEIEEHNVLEELPTLEEVMTRPIQRVDKGKGKEVVSEQQESTESLSSNKQEIQVPKRSIRVIPPIQRSVLQSRGSGSDDELEIIPVPQIKAQSIFDRIAPQQEKQTSSLHALRALAGLTSPGKRKVKENHSLTNGELQALLQRRARQQAARERAEKIEELKARGIIVQTAEEREKEQAEVEDLLEKARREADELKMKEKKLAKRNGQDTEDGDEVDGSSDEDWKEEEDGDLHLSGSDEEELEGNMETDGDSEGEGSSGDGDAGSQTSGPNAMLELEAEEDAEDEDDGDEANEKDDDEIGGDVSREQPPTRRKARLLRIIDDEDEDDEEATGSDLVGLGPSTLSPQKPEIPNIPAPAQPLLGLTQMFAGTMAESQDPNSISADKVASGFDQEQDSLAFLRQLPPGTLPELDFGPNDTQDIAKDSQMNTQQPYAQQGRETPSQADIDLHYSQSQVQVYDSQLRTPKIPSATQMSEFPDPTQDLGFENSPPIMDRFAGPPPSTIETVVMDQEENVQTPPMKRRARLRRRNEMSQLDSDVDDEVIDPLQNEDTGEFEISANAFDVMRNAKRKPVPSVPAFDKKRSNAKGMVDEQAEESEDEYAGLGGASDEESGGEEDEEVRKMINDDSEEKVDERALAALYADKERAQDEKAVEKLFKDITNGMLRRKRGADYDLSDSDDDGEARRRMKRREFAKMRKALLADENIGRIAENPKKHAFLLAIEDRESEENFDLLDEPEEGASQVIPDSQEGATIGERDQLATAMPDFKRKHAAVSEVNDENRPPPGLRRTQQPKRATTLAAIRESLSALIDDPDEIPATYPADSSDVEQDEGANDAAEKDPKTTRRSTSSNPAIIDRIMLKRAASSSTSQTRLAFENPAASGTTPGFRVPSLIRRATSGLSVMNDSSTTGGTERTVRADEGIRRGGTKKSSISFYAQEIEKRRIVEKVDAKRLKGRLKVAGERRGVLGGLGTGSFD